MFYYCQLPSTSPRRTYLRRLARLEAERCTLLERYALTQLLHRDVPITRKSIAAFPAAEVEPADDKGYDDVDEVTYTL